MGLLALFVSISLGATSAAPPLVARGAAELPALSHALPAESATAAPVDAAPAVAPNVSLLKGGADVRHVQKLLGHVCLDSTAIYTRVAPVDLAKAIEHAHPRERNCRDRKSK